MARALRRTGRGRGRRSNTECRTSRIKAGTFAPNTPYAARAKTGKGMPYFVPGWELARIGKRTMLLPSRIVRMACHQFIPALMSPDASM
jgi:hypothetical protein